MCLINRSIERLIKHNNRQCVMQFAENDRHKSVNFSSNNPSETRVKTTESMSSPELMSSALRAVLHRGRRRGFDPLDTPQYSYISSRICKPLPKAGIKLRYMTEKGRQKHSRRTALLTVSRRAARQHGRQGGRTGV